MSKKTNSLNLRSNKNKDLKENPFFENYNYSKLLYQDLYIKEYLKNVFHYNVHNCIVHKTSVQRKKDKVNIFLDYYVFKKKSNSKDKNIRRILSNTKRRFYWKSKRKLYLKYGKKGKLIKNKNRNNKKRRNFSSSKALSKVLQSNPILFLNFKNKNFYVYSFKRLLLLNLVKLTNCKVKLYSRNIAPLLKLPDFFLTFKQPLKIKKEIEKKNTIRKLMYKLKINPYANKLKNLDVPNFVHLVYSSFAFKNPELLGIFLSRVLKRNIKIFYIFQFFLSRTLLPLFLFSNLNGMKIQFKGRLGSSLRKRTSIMKFGSMPLQTIDSDIKFSFVKAITIYGICSIKIWYHY